MHIQLWIAGVSQFVGRARLIFVNHNAKWHRISCYIVCLSHDLSVIWILLYVNGNVRHHMDDATLCAHTEADRIGIRYIGWATTRTRVVGHVEEIMREGQAKFT